MMQQQSENDRELLVRYLFSTRTKQKAFACSDRREHNILSMNVEKLERKKTECMKKYEDEMKDIQEIIYQLQLEKEGTIPFQALINGDSNSLRSSLATRTDSAIKSIRRPLAPHTTQDSPHRPSMNYELLSRPPAIPHRVKAEILRRETARLKELRYHMHEQSFFLEDAVGIFARLRKRAELMARLEKRMSELPWNEDIIHEVPHEISASLGPPRPYTVPSQPQTYGLGRTQTDGGIRTLPYTDPGVLRLMGRKGLGAVLDRRLARSKTFESNKIRKRREAKSSTQNKEDNKTPTQQTQGYKWSDKRKTVVKCAEMHEGQIENDNYEGQLVCNEVPPRLTTDCTVPEIRLTEGLEDAPLDVSDRDQEGDTRSHTALSSRSNISRSYLVNSKSALNQNGDSSTPMGRRKSVQVNVIQNAKRLNGDVRSENDKNKIPVEWTGTARRRMSMTISTLMGREGLMFGQAPPARLSIALSAASERESRLLRQDSCTPRMPIYEPAQTISEENTSNSTALEPFTEPSKEDEVTSVLEEVTKASSRDTKPSLEVTVNPETVHRRSRSGSLSTTKLQEIISDKIIGQVTHAQRRNSISSNQKTSILSNYARMLQSELKVNTRMEALPERTETDSPDFSHTPFVRPIRKPSSEEQPFDAFRMRQTSENHSSLTALQNQMARTQFVADYDEVNEENLNDILQRKKMDPNSSLAAGSVIRRKKKAARMRKLNSYQRAKNNDQ